MKTFPFVKNQIKRHSLLALLCYAMLYFIATTTAFAQSCNLQFTGIDNIACNDNGTPTNPNDDFMVFNLDPVGTSLGSSYTATMSFTVFGVPIDVPLETMSGLPASGLPYGVPTQLRMAPGNSIPNFPGLGLSFDITVTDDDNLNCTVAENHDFPPICSVPCDLTGTGLSGITCNDNGTPTDANDDYMIFTLNPVGNSLGNSYSATMSVTVFGIPNNVPLEQLNGQPATNLSYSISTQLRMAPGNSIPNFPGLSISFTVTVTDENDANCTASDTDDLPTPCSTPPPPCDILNINYLGNPSACNDNGTPNDASDDFFTQNIQASFINRPTTGSLQIVPGGDQIGTYSIPVAQIVGNSHIFNAVQLKADGTPSVITMNFTDDPACSETKTGTTVQPCSASAPACEIIGFSFANIGPCNDNGTPSNPADDFFEVDVDVLYSNSFPASLSTVQLVGTDVIGTYSVNGQSGTNLTASFVDVKLRADGQATDLVGQLTVSFVGVSCSLPGTGPAVNSCSNGSPSCEVIGFTFDNISSCNDNGTPNDPADDFFTVNVNMIYSSSVNANKLSLFGGPPLLAVPGNAAPAGVGTNLTHTFVNVKFLATGQPVTFQGGVFFPNNSNCGTALPGTGPAVNSCAVPVPPNDACANAIPIACGQTLSGTTVGATPDQQFPTCNGLGTNSNTVYYSFIGTGNLMAVSICGQSASQNSILNVLTGTCSNLTCATLVASNTFDCGGFSGHRFYLPTTLGTTYFVRVTPVGNAAPGSFELTLNCYNPLPPNGSATVACPALAVPPVTPTYTPGVCNPNVPIGVLPGVVIVTNSPNPLVCEGTRDYTYVFFDCLGLTQQWHFTYTIERQPFAVPANGASTVACPNLATVPVPPTVTSQCGEVLVPSSPVITDNPATITCEGTRTFTFTYTDCEGNTAQWSHVTTIERQPFTITTPNGATTVNCPANLPATVTPPTVTSNCGETLTPTGPVITNNPATITCEGTRTFTFTYTDCEGNTAQWSHVFTVERQPFTINIPNGASTVACPSQITTPTPPVVTSNCGEVLTPTGPVIVNNPNPITCEGTRTFTWTFTDCEGNTAQWSHVTTVEREPFTIPVPNATALVDCPDDTDVQPTPPVVLSACGETLTPVLVNTTAKPGCEGHRVYTFRYTDCEGNTVDWLFTYQVEYQDFAIPANETESVECPSLATQPTPPVVFDNCGKLLTPTGPVITSTDNAQGCEASRQYAWTYKDCEGNTHVWSKTYHFFYSADFFVFNDETSVVACLAYAVQPIPPNFYDACGNEIKAALTNVTEDIAASGCKGWRRFEFSYTDCGGHSHPWSFTYEINDNEAPLGTCAANNGGPVTVNVDDLSCIEDVPCPDDYDFSSKIEELLVAGDFFDVCSGDDLMVELQASSDLWTCSDPDGDGVYTFGRTFYFRIADPCGNEYPGGCSVTYSGECLPIRTFRQEDWGIAGALPGSAMPVPATDLAIIADLLTHPNGTNNPLVIGGSHRSMTLTEAQCIVDLLPGTVWPAPLANCHQTNCSGPTGTSCNPMGIGGMKNSLAANAIALTLNLRFNNEYNNLAMNELRNQSLGCLEVSSYIAVCPTEANCQLRLFDGNGTAHSFPYTLGGLLDLANLYLDGGLGLSVGQQGNYGTAINQALLAVNAEWSGNQVATACGQDADVSPIGVDNQSFGSKEESKRGVDFSLTPNPASRYVKIRLGNFEPTGASEERNMQVEVFNTLGHRVLFQDLGKNASIEHRLELHGLKTGMYLVMVKVEGLRPFVEKLFVGDEVSLD